MASAPPFRPIQYLGSKQRLAETIASVIDDLDPKQSRVGDLFAGSGVVSGLLGAERPVTAVDMQAYSEVLSTAILNGSTDRFARFLTAEFRVHVEDVARRISKCLAPILVFEKEATVAAAAGNTDLLNELIECGSMAVHAQRVPQGTSSRLASLVKTGAAALGRAGFPDSDLTATRYFAGPYFSFQQAIALDAIYVVSKLEGGTREATEALAVLLSVASQVVNTVGKQFAQPMKLKKADGTVPPLLLERALRDRSLDVIETYQEWASRWARHSLGERREHRSVRANVVDFVSADRSCGVWYADPPYTIDHYSRFYHVLETLVLRDSPRLDEMRKRGELTIMRGVYRADRYSSPFCIPSRAPGAFRSLFAAAASRGTPLALSYSPFDETKGHRPRLLTLPEMIGIAREHYSHVSVMEVNEHSHRKLNAKGVNTAPNGDAERIIICRSKR